MECDLCGSKENGPRFYALEFAIEGKICGQCREELREERAEKRERELAARTYVTIDPARHDRHATSTPGLPVLTPGFTRKDLAPRAAVALILAETRRVFSGAPNRKQPAAPPCAVCGTTGGTTLAGRSKPHRTSGVAVGVVGVLCKNCYSNSYAQVKRNRRNAALQMGRAS